MKAFVKVHFGILSSKPSEPVKNKMGTSGSVWCIVLSIQDTKMEI